MKRVVKEELKERDRLTCTEKHEKAEREAT